MEVEDIHTPNFSSEPGTDEEGESSPEITELSAVEYFSLRLKTAQRLASEAEGPKKRVHTGKGRSERTIRRHKRAKMLMEAKGFLSLPEFFRWSTEKTQQQEFETEPAKVAEGRSENTPETLAMPLTSPEETEAVSVVSTESEEASVAPASTAIAEEEEEEEEEGEKISIRTVSRTPSSDDLGSFKLSSWVPSRTVLYESEESTSSCDSNTAGHPKELQSADTWELEGLRQGNPPDDAAPQQPMDNALELLQDRARLQAVQKELLIIARHKTLDAVLRGRVVAMVTVLNLYLEESLGYSWRRASEIAAKSERRGTNRARSVRGWVLKFVRTGELPAHKLGGARWTVLDDDDVAHEMKLALSERAKNGFLTASDIVDIVSSPEMQARFSRAGIHKASISERTARRWLCKLGWRYGRHKNGMYVDGHERQDVVEYREAFVKRFKEYERQFHAYNDAGNALARPSGFAVPGAIGRFWLILVTHDESIFYQNDQRQIQWACPGSGAPKPKGEGASLMVSDFLTADWGCLRDDNRCVVASFPSPQSRSRSLSEARVIFRPGKNRDGWFTASHLLAQVDHAIDIFDGLTKGYAQALFLFDNAPSHQKRADDAISARNMVKGVHCFLFTFSSFSFASAPKDGWANHTGGPRMRCGRLPTGETQSFYFPDDHPSMPGWFKGMEQIIRERGLWPEDGLPAQCHEFKCPPGRVNCCCRRVLFCQPDFTDQRSQLQELIERRGHLCDFYPKYHCELNFIEQFWGAAKARYRVAPREKSVQDMERTVRQCLDAVPLLQIRRLVLFVFLSLLIFELVSSLDLQTDLRVLSLLTGRAFRAHKPHGPIGSIMDTECCHPRVFSRLRTL